MTKLCLFLLQTSTTQTDPPPGNIFAEAASLSTIYDAYEKDYMLVLAKQRELEKQKEMEDEKEREKSGKAVNRCVKIMMYMKNIVIIIMKK